MNKRFIQSGQISFDELLPEIAKKSATKAPESSDDISRKHTQKNLTNPIDNSSTLRENSTPNSANQSSAFANQDQPQIQPIPEFSVSEATALFNQIFETATPTITVVGEVANFKINQNKWVFFDLKDDESSLSCFMSLFNLRISLEDGLKIAVTAQPKITKWGKFSLTVSQIRPVGEGSIKRAFELLRGKLDKEGLFAPERKRSLPYLPQKIGVISSVDAAGYKDFLKILSSRLGGLDILVAPVQVQGDDSANQIISALKFFNETGGNLIREDSVDAKKSSSRSSEVSKRTTQQSREIEAIVILRGGGSRDDLIAFDDEKLVRAVAASRIPVLTGIGHEIDTTLVDLAADVRASTPSNAAEILVPARREIISQIDYRTQNLFKLIRENLTNINENLANNLREISSKTETIFTRDEQRFNLLLANLQNLNPREILRRGYAIIRDQSGAILRAKPQISDKIIIENLKYLIESEVQNVREKS